MTDTTSTPAVRLDEVTKRYGSVVANDRLSLDIAAGEFFSFLGPSGCGKTTLLRCIGGFIVPDGGRVVIGGKDVSGVAPNHRPTNMVFQDYALFPHLDVAGNVGFSLRERRMAKAEIRERVTEALRVVHLEGYERRRPDQLSGGQQQRVALARALVNEPVVLLLDEPLGALDLRLRRAMQLELKRIQRDVGITFVYVTHDQEEAMTMSDRIAVMNAGRFEQVGTPEEIYERPETLFVAGFIGEANLLPVTVVATGSELVVSLPTGDRLAVSQDGQPHAAPDQPRTLLVRPEQVKLSDEQPEPGLGAPGVLVEAIYQGSSVRYEVELRDGTRVVSATPKAERTAAADGDDVWVWWERDDARLLDDGDAGSQGLDDPAMGGGAAGAAVSGSAV